MTEATVADVDTGVCVVLVEPTAERSFVTTQGAERRISVESRPGEGSRFLIVLPRRAPGDVSEDQAAEMAVRG